MVNVSEREDFEQAIRSKGLDLDDFELVEQQDPMEGQGIHAITGTVAIRRKSNGVQKTYQAGHGSTWVAEFSDDLNKGVFA